MLASSQILLNFNNKYDNSFLKRSADNSKQIVLNLAQVIQVVELVS